MKLRKEEEGSLKVRDFALRQVPNDGFLDKKQSADGKTRGRGSTLAALARLPPRQKKLWEQLPSEKKRRFLKAVRRREAASFSLFSKKEYQTGGQRFRRKEPLFGALFSRFLPWLSQERGERGPAHRRPLGGKERKRISKIRPPQTGQTVWSYGKRNGQNTPGQKGRPGEETWTDPGLMPKGFGGRDKNGKNGKPQGRFGRQPAGKQDGIPARGTLVRLLEQDARKEAGIQEERREERISLEEQTQAAKTAALRTAFLPVRVRFLRLKENAAAKLLPGVKNAAWHLALAALALFLPLLLVLFLVALLGGLAGEEERKEQYQAAYPVSGYEIAAYAKEWVGITQYVWGAGRNSETDWQDYADCSSFARGVFSHFGVEIGSTTYAQENAGTLVEGGLSQAEPGDLILFYSGSVSPGNSSHVGIYLGEGQMVHCSGGRANTYGNPGRGVCVGSVQADGRPYAIRRVAFCSFSGGEALLSVLSSYNARMEADSKEGSKWWYTNRGTALTWEEANANGPKATNCALLVRWALKDLGILDREDFFYYTYGNTFRWTGDTEAHLRQRLEILEVRATARNLIRNGNLQPGDICCWHSMQHVNVYAGDNRWFDAGRGGTNGHWESFGHMDSGGWESTTYVFDQWGPVPTGYLDTQVDYILRLPAGSAAGNGTSGGHRIDSTSYTQAEMELIWAIVAQEDNGSYAGALAVLSSAMNRTESKNWNVLGSNALSQLTAPGQYCYSMDDYWRPRLNGNVPNYVKQAVYDCLKKGIRNHPYTSFRSTKGSQTGPDAVQIGGNWFFGS